MPAREAPAPAQPPTAPDPAKGTAAPNEAQAEESSSTLSALPTGADKTGVSSQAIAVPEGAGKIQGMGESFSAQISTGIATFTVPIALPTARGEAQPALMLSYSSAAGQSVVGLGWSLGVPFVARQTDRGIPKYKDPALQGGWYPEQDRFVFNGGQELVPICQVGDTLDPATQGPDCSGKLPDERMPDWSPRWQYFRARVEGSFQRLFWSPDHRTWRVQDKSGVVMELGVALDGANDTQALERDPGDTSRIYRWNLARQYDSHVEETSPGGGAAPRPVNLSVFRYATFDGEAYLTDIYDTPPIAQAAAASIAQYAHHAHFAYEQRGDRMSSFRRGWQTTTAQRLTRIDVTSKTFAGAAEPRHLVRRYHFAYDPSFHASLLKSIQLEGRCASREVDAPAEDAGGLVALSSCARLPAMTFDYQHVGGFDTSGKSQGPDLVGYEGFDERVRTLANSPDHGIDEELTDLFDINSDGLPDVLVTAPGVFGGKHGVFFNGLTGTPDSFGSSTIEVNGVLGANAATITLKNANVAPLDLDGDGVIDLLHMPATQKYAVYTPKEVAGAWFWQGRAISTASGQNPKIDFGRDALDLKVVDVNADGLVDVVFSGGLEWQTFFALGRYPGGDGQFGSATWLGPDSAEISNDPIRTCVPWDATPVRLSDPDIRLGDMNGDGLADVVRIRRGDIRYWPGRGNGLWGTGALDDCPASTFGAGRDILMGQSPQYSDIEGTSLLLDDVNGDGLDDLVQVRFDAVDVWLNVDGSGWTPNRHVIQRTPASPSFANRVRLVDVNGSGTRDILWGDSTAYKYMDLSGGTRPGVLSRISNGLGKTTEIEYSSSTALMLQAARQGVPWSTKAPMPLHMVTRVSESDNLDIVGRRRGKYVREYDYRDPVYDGRQREFRGFQAATVRRVGDDNSPTSVTTSTFLVGDCQDEDPADGLDPCAPENRWRENGQDALKGLVAATETSDERNTYISSEHNTYRLRLLYPGLDGRQVRHAFTAATEKYLYDTGPFGAADASASAVTLVDVERELQPGVVAPARFGKVTLRSPASKTAHLHSGEVVVTSVGPREGLETDHFGNNALFTDAGCVGACGPQGIDEAILIHTVPGRLPHGSGWLFRTLESFVTGVDGSVRRAHKVFTYTHQGDPLDQTTELFGSLPLDRANDAGKAPAPPPPDASGGTGAPVMIPVLHEERDSFGVVRFQSGPNGRCRFIGHDEAYEQLATSETIRAGSVPSGETCGDVSLVASATYDRGFEVADAVVGLHGEPSRVAYDGFGRLVELTRPSPYVPAGEVPTLSTEASVKIEYRLPSDPTTQPYSIVHSFHQDGDDQDSSQYRESWAYLDGFGRTMVTLAEADPSAGDEAKFVAQGLPDYDAKGQLQRTFLPFFYDGDPSAFPLGQDPPTAYGRRRYDAFGRPLETFGLDGIMTVRNVYHALGEDKWDAEDLAPGPHHGTPASIFVDGHGRKKIVSERVHLGNAIEEHRTVNDYLPTGEVVRIVRMRVGQTDADVVRWMQYDSLGRLVLNAEPHTSKNFHAEPTAPIGEMRAWRYAYNDSSDLVGISDARGCGVNYGYDAAGRILFEDYSPCTSAQEDYSPPDLAAQAGTEVLYHYDDIVANGTEPGQGEAPPGDQFPVVRSLYLGRLAWVADGAARTLMRYDGRGRLTGAARRVARPGIPATAIADRYAPRWYLRKVNFDADDRPIRESTGASVPELLNAPQAALNEGTDPARLAPDNRSVVTTEYTARGMVKRVAGSYGALITSVTHTADDRVSEMVYADAAGTTTHSTFDDDRRVRSIQTYRGAPPIWTGPPASYQPAPEFGGTHSPTTFQLLLEDQDFQYDAVDNPIEIRDWRLAGEWPTGAKPATRKIAYDDLYRMTRVDYEYEGGGDAWTSPFAAENAGASDPRRAQPSPHVSFDNRVLRQTFQYDWRGSMSRTADDANGFYDRSLGSITSGSGKPYQVVGASNESTSADRRGHLSGRYDDAGNLVQQVLVRRGPCLPAGGKCSQYLAYDWDEVGRLVRGRRWDLDAAAASQLTAASPPPVGAPAADLLYAYDSNDARVIKRAVGGTEDRSSLFVFSTLEFRRASFVSGDYDRTTLTEVPYLQANDVRLARVVFEPGQVPALDAGKTHVFLEMGDHLGSTSIVLDKATGELVERSTYEAYGAPESDYRPDRWDGFREDYRFTGKEDDVEIGLAYFGKRYYSAGIGAWISADPLTVHSPTEGDPNLYAYVKGSPFKGVDRVGLDGASTVAMQFARQQMDVAAGRLSKEDAQEINERGAKIVLGMMALYACRGTCALALVGIGMVTAETPDQSAMALLGLPGAAEAPALKMLAQEEAVVGPALKQASAEMETAAPVVSKMEQAAAPMSEVAASEANMCQGVEASASTSPAMTPITNPQRLLPGMTTGAANNVRGNAFEKLVMDSLRAEKNAAKASSVATRVNAVPEVMNDVRFGGGLEAKDEKYLSLTKQIKAEIAIAQTGPQKGPFYMVIGPGTARASMPLQNAVNRTGGGFFEYNPVTDTWSTVQFNGTRVVRAPPPHP